MSALVTENTATDGTELINRELWSREFVELLVTQFLFGLSMSLFYLLPKYLRISLHASASQIGMVMGAGLVASVLATPLAAIWLRNGQRRMPARCGLLMLTCSAIAYTKVTEIGPLLLGLRVVQGSAYTLFASAVVTRAAEIAPKERLAQAMGYVGLAALVTNALSPLIAEPMASRFGWSSVFTLAFVAGVGALVWTRTLNDQARHSTVHRRVAARSMDQPLASVLYATMICGVALGVMFTFTQPLALERGAREVGPLFSGYVMAAAAVRLCLPKLADRFGRRRSAALGITPKCSLQRESAVQNIRMFYQE
ncbi:MAG TPA: MFS transporter [Polyangiaceae bacterium]